MTKQNGNGNGHGSSLMNISELHRLTDLDRTTIRERLEAAGIAPRQERAKEKLYDLAEAISALMRHTPQASNYNEARTRKTSASAEREWLKFQVERGDLVPIAEIRNYAYYFVKAMQERFEAYARENKDRLHGEKTPNALERTMIQDFEQIFLSLKNDHARLF